MNSVNDIFFIPIGDLIDRKTESMWLVYSPLAESMIFAGQEEAKNLHDHLSNQNPFNTNEELKQVADALTTYEPIENRNDQIKSSKDFVTLYILPNYACNFKCSYCFAAYGRDKQRMNPEHLQAMIDWMLQPTRTTERRIYITFLGGGEPIISFDIMRNGIEYGNHLARERGFEILWNVVTNGSLITNEMLNFFQHENVTVRYSFEIIKEIQLSQRGDFETVDKSIRTACNKGMNPVIRAMITPQNVTRLCEMINLISGNYPGVRLLKIDPVTDAEYGKDLNKMRRFYQTFNAEYLKAKSIGSNAGIDVQCVTERNLDSVTSRFCAGEISLNAYGEITACHRISSPKEKGYNDMLYGYVDDVGVHINENKFCSITSDKIETKHNCSECFLKYNCAGGCRVQNEQYTPEMQHIVCHYTRELSRRLLFDRLCCQLSDDTGIPTNNLFDQKEETI